MSLATTLFRVHNPNLEFKDDLLAKKWNLTSGEAGGEVRIYFLASTSFITTCIYLKHWDCIPRNQVRTRSTFLHCTAAPLRDKCTPHPSISNFFHV